MQRKYRELANRAIFPFYRDLSTRTEVFLWGSPRSGTTWIQEAINYRKDHRVLFEPFRAGGASQDNLFPPEQYVRPDDPAPHLLEPARLIMSGRVRSRWVDQELTRFIYRKRMIKDVHSNLMARWLNVNFPDVPMVWLVRHPCAVAESMISTDLFMEGWRRMRLLNQPQLMEDHLEPFKELILSCELPFEQAVLLWCVQQYVPFRQFRPGQVLLMFYERILAQPEVELRRLFEYLGRGHEAGNRKLLSRIKRPSRTTGRTSALRGGSDPSSAWRQRLAPDQIRRARELLGHFGLDGIYGEEVMPKAQAATALLEANAAR